VSRTKLAPDEERNNQRSEGRKRRRDDLGESVVFDRSYRADIAALMKHVKDVLAYIDTVELYIAGQTPDDPYFDDLCERIMALQQIERLDLRRVTHRNIIVGRRLLIHQPRRETLFLLDEMLLYPAIWFHRFDFAYDFITATPYYANAVRLHLLRHLILRWCRSPYMPDVLGTTTYFGKYKNVPKRKRPVRNAILYCDLPSKLTGDPCGHLDLRTVTAPAIRKLGVEKPSDLLDLDPASHFGRNLILVGDYWGQIEDLRKHDPRLRHRTQDYRAHLLNKYCDAFKVNRIGIEALRLPSKLTFRGVSL
jgi:hypothetical protein